MTVNLYDMNLSLFDVPVPAKPAEVVPAPKAEPSYVVTIRQTKTGKDIMVCTAHPAPADAVADAKAKGLPLFTGPEITTMASCPPEMVDYILRAKVVFPGATIQSIIKEAEHETVNADSH